jgi:hypothetical protein
VLQQYRGRKKQSATQKFGTNGAGQAQRVPDDTPPEHKGQVGSGAGAGLRGGGDFKEK